MSPASPATPVALPAGVGRLSVGWVLMVLLLAGVAGFGFYAYAQQLQHGEIVTGMRTIGQGGAAWGLFIVFYVYFVGVSFAGIVVSSLIRLFGIAELRSISRMAELITIIALLLGGMSVMADLGRPLRGLLYLPMYARPSSAFFGTFTLVTAGYLFASLVYFYLAGRADAAFCANSHSVLQWIHRMWASGHQGTLAEHHRHHHVSFWLALAILPLLVTAHSSLGFVFGIQSGRPGWFSALQAPGFVVLAGVSGVGVLLVVAAAVRKFLHQEEKIRPQAFRWLGNFLWILILTYLYFMVVEELTANYASTEMEAKVAHEVVLGTYAWAFWTVVATLLAPLVILFIQFVSGGASIGWSVVAGLLVNVAAVLKRFLIVVPSQTHGAMLPYPEGHYTPTWVELSVIVGLFALGTLLFLLFVKIFPIVPIPIDETVLEARIAVESVTHRRVRLGLFWITLIAGISLAVVGFLASARFGTEPYHDPLIPYSPVLFIFGVMMSFYSAAIYETLPPVRSRPLRTSAASMKSSGVRVER